MIAEDLTDLIEIRVQDYRDVTDGPYDAISSIGMAERVGAVESREYADTLYALLKPGGRLLNHQISRRPEPDEEAYEVDVFIDAYVFPDGELAPIGRALSTLEDAGFEVRDVEAIRGASSRSRCAAGRRLLEAPTGTGRSASPRPAGPGSGGSTSAASAVSFERDRIGVNRSFAVKTPVSGVSGRRRCGRASWNEKV
ncbi:cyclopropane-fatty-acyl-phospholipid synthase family protein [Streptomyces tanashiensis]